MRTAAGFDQNWSCFRMDSLLNSKNLIYLSAVVLGVRKDKLLIVNYIELLRQISTKIYFSSTWQIIITNLIFGFQSQVKILFPCFCRLAYARDNFIFLPVALLFWVMQLYRIVSFCIYSLSKTHPTKYQKAKPNKNPP